MKLSVASLQLSDSFLLPDSSTPCNDVFQRVKRSVRVLETKRDGYPETCKTRVG